MSLVIANRVCKYYGNDEATRVHALWHVDFTISPGEYIAVMGPSGSGKSTLLAILGAMNPPSEGSLLVDGIDVYALSQEKRADFRREYLGFVFQQPQLISYLTSLENVMLPLVVSDVKDKKGLAAQMLEKVGLGDKAKRLPSELSGGEQSRVAIARAIINDPPMLLADEPVGSLDSKTGSEILDLFQALHADGQTIIMVTHNPDSIRDTGRLIQLKDGVIVSDAATEEVLFAASDVVGMGEPKHSLAHD